MANPEFYYERQQLSEVKKYKYNEAGMWNSTTALISGVSTSTSPSTGLTVAETYSGNDVILTVGTSSTASTYTVTVTVTADDSEIDIFHVVVTTVADTA